MRSTRRILADLLTRQALAIRGPLTRLSDAQLAKGLETLQRVLPSFAAQGLEELLDLLRAGPPGTTVLRTLIMETRPDELNDVIRGILEGRSLDPTR